jgi:ketosteroid isomerase-like protein
MTAASRAVLRNPIPVHLMRFLFLMVGIALGTTIQAQNSPQAEEARIIMNLEADWGKALVNRDTVAFHRLLAPGFVYTEDAKMMSRREVINGVMTGDRTISATNVNMNVHESGPVAVVTGIFVVTIRTKTGLMTNRYRFTDVWLNSGGKWQAVAAQDHTISAGPAK